MKKLFLISILFFAPLINGVESDQENKGSEFFKKQLQFVTRVPLDNHFELVQKMISQYLTSLGFLLMSDASDLAKAAFQESSYFLFIDNVRLKLRMPSVTAEEKQELITKINDQLNGLEELRKDILSDVKKHPEIMGYLTFEKNIQYIKSGLESILEAANK